MVSKASVSSVGWLPGSVVRLVAVEGPWVLRPDPDGRHETVGTEKVGDDGSVMFSGKGVEAGARFIALGFGRDGLRQEVRLAGSAEPVAAQALVVADRAQVGVGGIGGYADQRPRVDDEGWPDRLPGDLPNAENSAVVDGELVSQDELEERRAKAQAQRSKRASAKRSKAKRAQEPAAEEKPAEKSAAPEEKSA